MLQEHQVGTFPVVAEGRFVGLVFERDLLSLMTPQGGLSNTSSEGIRQLVQPSPSVSEMVTVHDLIALFKQHPEIDVLPLVNLEGIYRGAVIRRDLLASLCSDVRPPMVGGMATPLGVYLTTGNLRGGVRDGALFLTGLMIAGLLGLAYGVLFFLGWIVDCIVGSSFHLMIVSQEFMLFEYTSGNLVIPLAFIPTIFVLLLQLSGLTGYHASEHQVVHAMEGGYPLHPEWVKAMPREHPRCGTNLAIILFTIIISSTLLYAGHSWNVVLPPAVLAVLFRKPLGRILQTYCTTRCPSSRQIDAAIRAATELTSRYQACPDYRAPFLKRVWNRGLIQVLIGLLGGSAGLYGLFHWGLQRGLAVLIK